MRVVWRRSSSRVMWPIRPRARQRRAHRADRLELSNGYLNRILLIACRRQRLLPEGGQLDHALRALQAAGRATVTQIATGGRPAQLWTATPTP